MKTKTINTKYLNAIWQAGVKTVLFPDSLIGKLTPDKTIELQGDRFISIREARRLEIDLLIDELISSDTPEMLAQKLTGLDPMSVALYYDRVRAATESLAAVESEYVEIQESWYSFVSFLLQQKIFQ